MEPELGNKAVVSITENKKKRGLTNTLASSLLSGVGKNRTADTWIFSPLLYHLSYDTISFRDCKDRHFSFVCKFFRQEIADFFAEWMFLAKFAAMTGRIFIQVILPLRLEWEPFYYVDEDGAVRCRGQRQPLGTGEMKLAESAEPEENMTKTLSRRQWPGGQDTSPGGQVWNPEIEIGDRLRVDFGGKEYVGVVSAVDAGERVEAMGIMDRVKPITGMADGLPPVSSEEIALWRKIAEYYLCTVGEVYKAAYPAQKVTEEAVQARREAAQADKEEKKRARLEEKAHRLKERIEKKEEMALKARKAETRERYLAEKKALEIELRELTGGMADTLNGTYATDDSKFSAENCTYTAEGSKHSAENVTYTAEDSKLSAENCTYTTEDSKHSAESGTYTAEGSRLSAESGTYTTDDGKLSERNGSYTAENAAEATAFGKVRQTDWFKAGNEIVLSAAQEEAYSRIKEVFSLGKPALLRGVTGSGKTEIYLKLAKEALAKGRNVLYLVPEIALSRQLEERIGEAFPDALLVFHSGETSTRKREAATALRRSSTAANGGTGKESDRGHGHIVLGTRSAIFLPHRNLGLVIVDEEHDTSYKQDSPAPRYNGRETAIMMARIFGADVILGSATPSLESLYNCSVGRYGLVTLDKRFYEAEDSDIEIVDTIAERRKNGMVGNFSRKLIAHINRCLGQHKQVLILRERRSYSPAVQCQGCGDIPKCRHCNVSLSLHRRSDGTERLVCHYCGRVYEYTGKCRACGSPVKPLGAGTQKIEEEAAALFSGARIARLDSDTAQSRKLEKDVIKRFSKGEIDILIGTRMVAKGFDFSGLTLVAVLQADSILGQEDYRADERGLQLLEQFRGRCGRREEKGLFVIQTSQPEHPVYQSIDGKLDESGTVERFLSERKLFGYPPYSRVVGIIVKDYNQPRADLLSRELADAVRTALGVKSVFAPGVQSGPSVIGPYSPAIDKVSGQNIRQIRVLLPKDRSLGRNKETLAAAVAHFEKEKKYFGHIALDVDPA